MIVYIFNPPFNSLHRSSLSHHLHTEAFPCLQRQRFVVIIWAFETFNSHSISNTLSAFEIYIIYIDLYWPST